MIKKTFVSLMNKYEIMQHALVDLVLDAPQLISFYSLRVLNHCERGRGLLNDQKIFRELTDNIRVASAVRKLQDAGFSCTVDRIDGYCIWIEDETIDFVFDTLNGEPEFHPKFIKTNERNIDALVSKKEVEMFIYAKNRGKDE